MLEFQYQKTRYPEEDLTWYNHVDAVPFLIDDLFAAYTCLMRFTLFLATRTLVHWRKGGGGMEGGREGGWRRLLSLSRT